MSLSKRQQALEGKHPMQSRKVALKQQRAQQQTKLMDALMGLHPSQRPEVRERIRKGVLAYQERLRKA